jgi:tetratricopeptide (TPR) repeat protein
VTGPIPPVSNPAGSPRHAFQQAVSYHAQGRLREAEQLYQTVLQSEADHLEALFRLGWLCAQQGRFAQAQHFAGRAVKLSVDSAEGHHLLGIALAGLNSHEEALQHYEKALAIKPDCAEAHNNFGYSLQSLGRSEESISHFKAAIAIAPAYPEAHNNLGSALIALGQCEEAISHFQEALALRPNYAEAHHNVGNCLTSLNRHEALAQYRKATATKSDHADAYYKHGKTLERLGRDEEAVTQYEKAISINPRHVDARLSLGEVLGRLRQVELGLAHYSAACTIDPLHMAAQTRRGSALFALGKVDEAIGAFETAIASAPRSTRAYLSLVQCRRLSATDRHFIAMTELAQQMASLTAADQINLHFALGKAFADIGDAEASFRHFLQGNALQRSNIRYDEGKSLGLLERIRSVFTKELMAQKSFLGDPSSVPIFIIGMPRSGSTLVEQIIASHSRVFGAGELPELGMLARGAIGPQGRFPEAVRDMSGEDLRRIGGSYVRAARRLAPGAARITDKMLDNFALAGVIHLALPNARILHIQRDPRDTALSCFSHLFRHADYSYDLAELGRYYRAYRRLMAHWRDVLPAGVMLNVQYEDLIANIGQQARRLVAHCGLDWDAACLSFYKTKRPVFTASAAQVRQPIYRSSAGRWRPYERLLAPFMEALEGGGGGE